MREHHEPDFRLTSLREMPSLPTRPQLGLDVTKPAEAKLKLSSYLTEPTNEIPPAVSRRHDGWAWNMLANDRYGDCVECMVLHSIQDFEMDAGHQATPFMPTDALGIYSAVTGFNQSDPSTDRGTDMGSMMRYWENEGCFGHKIAGFVEIDPTSLHELQVGVYEFIDVQLAIALPATAQGQRSWDLLGNPQNDPYAAPGSWGGHGVPIREYDSTGFTVVTWGSELHMTNAFATTYIVQAFVVYTADMLNNSGTSPTGLAWDDLVSDAKKILQ